MIVVQRRFSNVMVSDTKICPTLENAMGAGGGNVPIILEITEDETNNADREKILPMV